MEISKMSTLATTRPSMHENPILDSTVQTSLRILSPLSVIR